MSTIDQCYILMFVLSILNQINKCFKNYSEHFICFITGSLWLAAELWSYYIS